MRRLVICAGIALIFAAAMTAQTPSDGFYFAQDANYTNNQRNQVVLQVQGGKITSANWNLLSLAAGSQDLKSIARAGQVAGAVTWAGEAAKAESFLVTSQNVNATSVAGVASNFNVGPFFTLVKAALAASPISKGIYSKDGWYFALAASPDEYHTRNSVLITIVNGTIVDVLWNGAVVGLPASMNPSKMILSRNNQYPMTGAKSSWDQQAEAVALELKNAQNPDLLKMKADGTADGISGASMLINHFLDVAKQALAAAR